MDWIGLEWTRLKVSGTTYTTASGGKWLFAYLHVIAVAIVQALCLYRYTGTGQRSRAHVMRLQGRTLQQYACSEIQAVGGTHCRIKLVDDTDNQKKSEKCRE